MKKVVVGTLTGIVLHMLYIDASIFRLMNKAKECQAKRNLEELYQCAAEFEELKKFPMTNFHLYELTHPEEVK